MSPPLRGAPELECLCGRTLLMEYLELEADAQPAFVNCPYCPRPRYTVGSTLSHALLTHHVKMRIEAFSLDALRSKYKQHKGKKHALRS